MKNRAVAFAVALSLSLPAVPAAAAESVDLDAVTRIREEGFKRSKVGDISFELLDKLGPRLTGSPNYRRSAEWAKAKLTELGLANARIEPFEFGRGWKMEKVSLRMTSPDVAFMPAVPKAWTPGTNGPVRGKAILAKLEEAADLDKWKGKLAGAVLLVGEVKEPKAIDKQEKPESYRLDEKGLEEVSSYAVRAGGPPRDMERAKRRYEFSRKLRKFLEEEKVVAVIEATRGADGLIFVQGGGAWKKAEGEGDGVPQLVTTQDAFQRAARLLDKKVDVEIEVDVTASYTPEDPLAAANILAEIPGTDKKLADEVVMIGAHFDSWHAGTGATDNGAGTIAAMEAVRILKAAGLNPRRTVRIALWGGEEEGLMGSRDWVAKNLAARPDPTDPKEKDLPSWMRKPTGPLQTKPAHAKVSGYFNLDNGTGKVRGIYSEDNAAIRPVFEPWVDPLKDLGVSAVTLRRTGGTDHMSFDGVGVPGFQFVQDEMDYNQRTHHSNADTLDRLVKEDLMQAAVVMATFVWQTAQRDGMLPRKPMPKDDPAPKADAKPEVKPDAKADPKAEPKKLPTTPPATAPRP